MFFSVEDRLKYTNSVLFEQNRTIIELKEKVRFVNHHIKENIKLTKINEKLRLENEDLKLKLQAVHKLTTEEPKKTSRDVTDTAQAFDVTKNTESSSPAHPEENQKMSEGDAAMLAAILLCLIEYV